MDNNLLLKKIKAYFFGIVAAVAYGTNPLGALFLYDDGFNPSSVIFYRFVFAVLILGLVLLVKRESFKVSKFEFTILSSLGVLFAASALSLYTSFKYMDSGIASTILFAYPVMVAVIMAFFFKEKTSFLTVCAIVLSIVGIVLLYRGDGNETLSVVGVLLVLVSSLTYAVYIVVVNRSKIRLNPFKETFYIMAVAAVVVFLYSLCSPSTNLIAIPGAHSLFWLVFLALVPTIVAMTLLNMSIERIGSTPTAVLGALEPVTAVIISIFVFEGAFTARLMLGIVLILFSVLIITVLDKIPFSKIRIFRKRG